MYFVSHSSRDADAAARVVEYLERRGVPCWIAPRDIAPGASYPSQIVKAIRECEGFILVASEKANLSDHITSEIARAFDLKKRIIPFMLESIEFSDDNLYYLGRFQWIDASGDLASGLETLFLAVASDAAPVPAGRQKSAAPAPAAGKTAAAGDPSVRVATYQDLQALGYSALQIARRLVENDMKLYAGMTAENEGTSEQWAEYLSAYPETFRYLINGEGEIVGNWSFLAISEEVHAEKLARGELEESTFSLDETEFLLFPGDYAGYLLNLSVNIGYNSMKNVNLLVNAFTEQLIAFAEQGIFFRSWHVNVFRKDHEAMYRRIGFSYLLDNRTFGKLFMMECTPFPEKSIFAADPRLSELYREHFV